MSIKYFKPENFQRPYAIRVILVKSIYPRNVGATSRAMCNMGVDELILISPQCEIDFEGQQAAARGQGPLQNRKVYSSWSDFFAKEPEGLRLSFTARDGRGRLVKDFSEVLNDLPKNAPQLQIRSEEPVYIDLIFGPEDWGLSAEDLEHSHWSCSIPTYGDNTSLNLAQAVLLALFMVRQSWGGEKAILEGQAKSGPRRAPVIFPDSLIKEWLQEMGFDLSKKKMNSFLVLRRMLLQNTPTTKEFRILEIILNQSIRKLKEYNQLRLENERLKKK